MTKAAWCTVTPTSGKENGTINISASAHTGRVERNTSVTVTAKNGEKPSATVNVSQAGKALFVTMDETKPDVPKTGGTVTINGVSNSTRLDWDTYFDFFGSEVNVEEYLSGFSASVIAAGEPVHNHLISDNILRDPGATAEYSFTATLVIPQSPIPMDINLCFRMHDADNNTKVCRMVFKAGASSLSVNTSSLSLVNAGTAQAVNVTSNDEWIVS